MIKTAVIQRRIIFTAFTWLMSFMLVIGPLSDNVLAVAAPLFCEQQYILYGGCLEPCQTGSTTDAPTPSGDGGGCGEKKGDSKANKDQIWGFFVNKFMGEGYSKEEAEKATAGIMGNWLQESGFNPDRHNAPNPGSGCNGASGPITGSVGLGIAQWCGGRQQDLMDFAAGRDISCLGVQLEFTWKEMGERDLYKKMKGLSPAESSQIFDEIFEVSNGTGERQKKGEQMYAEYTGKDPGGLSTTSDQGNNCKRAAGAIPGAQCSQAVPAFREAMASGKIEGRENVEKDLENCSDTDFKYCTPGAQAVTLRGIVAMSQAPGVESVGLNNINDGHDCDEMDHPNGLATDIEKCNGKAANSDEAACFALIDFLVENREELNIRYIIWDGSYCQQKLAGSGFGECRGDHNNHIHVSFNGDKNGYNE